LVQRQHVHVWYARNRQTGRCRARRKGRVDPTGFLLSLFTAFRSLTFADAAGRIDWDFPE
jgi:hypothetical protein